MLFLGVDPASHLVEFQSRKICRELIDPHHCLADGCTSLLDLGDECGIVKDATWDLAVTSTQAEHEVESGFLLDVVVLQSAAILELLASEDKALLVGRDTFLVLNLSLDSLDCVGSFHLKGDSFACQRLHKDLHVLSRSLGVLPM